MSRRLCGAAASNTSVLCKCGERTRLILHRDLDLITAVFIKGHGGRGEAEGVARWKPLAEKSCEGETKVIPRPEGGLGVEKWHFYWENGAPGVIRTLDLVLRRHTLYPAELRARRAVPLILKHFSIPQQSVSSSIGQWSEPQF